MTIWFHQPQSVVRAWGPSRAPRAAMRGSPAFPYRSLDVAAGERVAVAERDRTVSFVVELPPGELPDALARRHADAVLRLAD